MKRIYGVLTFVEDDLVIPCELTGDILFYLSTVVTWLYAAAYRSASYVALAMNVVSDRNASLFCCSYVVDS